MSLGFGSECCGSWFTRESCYRERAVSYLDGINRSSKKPFQLLHIQFRNGHINSIVQKFNCKPGTTADCDIAGSTVTQLVQPNWQISQKCSNTKIERTPRGPDCATRRARTILLPYALWYLPIETPRKLSGFHQTKERFWPDFADIKHYYTQVFYRSFSFFISQDQ